MVLTKARVRDEQMKKKANKLLSRCSTRLAFSFPSDDASIEIHQSLLDDIDVYQRLSDLDRRMATKYRD